MKNFYLLLAACLILPCAGCTHTQQPSATAVKNVDASGYRLKVLDNSATLSQAARINAVGHVIGVREVMNEDKTIYRQQVFFSDGQQSIDIPLLEEFTNTSVAALSDNDRVVGYASRPMGHPDGSLTAIVWDAATRKLTNLGCFEGDETSHAQDISADGTRITGYTTGSNPARMRPCVWDYAAAEDDWNCQLLPAREDYNPFLQASSVLVSPDGKTIAACITENRDASGNIDNALYMWELKDESWQKRKLSDDYLRLSDLNNSGVIVGEVTSGVNRVPVRVSAEGEFLQIDLLADDVAGVAHGINEAGIIVGQSDDPSGPEGGPQAFIWQNGETKPLELLESTEFSAALGINDNLQVAGLADFVFDDEGGVSTTPVAELEAAAEATDEDQLLIRTLGFIRTPDEAATVSVESIK